MIGEELQENKPTYLRLLKNRNYLLLWLGQAVSSLGDWIIVVAMISLVYKLSRSSLAVGTLMVFKMLPALFFGSIAGVIVDRFDRRRLMIACDIIRSLLILTLPFMKNIFGVYGIAFLLETCAILFMPAKDASIPDIVGEEDILTANSISHTTNYLTMIMGSAFGATIILLVELVWGHLPFFARLTGPSAAFYIDSGTFMLSALALSFIRLPKPDIIKTEKIDFFKIKEDLFGGFALMGNDGVVKYMLISLGIAILGGGSIYSLGVVYSTEVLKIGEAGFGYMISALGVGLVIGGFIAGTIGRFLPKDKIFSFSILAFGISMVAFSSISNYQLVIAIIVLAGVNLAILNITAYTIIHENVEGEVRGRVFSILESMIRVFLLASLTISSIVADIASRVLKRFVATMAPPNMQAVYIARFNGARMTLILGGVAVIVAGLIASRKIDLNNGATRVEA